MFSFVAVFCLAFALNARKAQKMSLKSLKYSFFVFAQVCGLNFQAIAEHLIHELHTAFRF